MLPIWNVCPHWLVSTYSMVHVMNEVSQHMEAMNDSADHLRARVAFLTGEVHRLVEEKVALQEQAEQRHKDLTVLLAGANKVISQFMPNIPKCFGIDFQLLNDTARNIQRVLDAEADQNETPN